MRKQQRFVFQMRVGFNVLIAGLWLLTGIASWGQTGKFPDQGGSVFNVKAYGATGNGSTDDTASIQRAIDAALAAGGGIVSFPVGRYLLKGTLTNSRVDVVSLVGSGMGTNLLVQSDLGISLGSTAEFVGQHGYHSGRIEGMQISCSNPSKSTAVRMTDMLVAPELRDLTVSRCNQAFDLINQKFWTERLMATNIADFYNNHLFHLDQSPSDKWDSYGYGIYDGIFLNKAAGQDVFYMTGGGNLYHSKFVIKGNFDLNATGASVFNLQGAVGQPCPGGTDNSIDVAVEGAGYSVLRASGNGCKAGLWGSAFFRGTGPVVTMGQPAVGGSDSITNSSGTALVAGVLTASNATSDSVSARGVIPGTACFVEPTNAIAAAAMNGTYVSSTSWGTVVVAHPPAARGGTFQVWCTAK